MAITIPVTHAAKQKNSRKSPKSTDMFTHPSLRCAGATLAFQEIAFYRYPHMGYKNCRLSVVILLLAMLL